MFCVPPTSQVYTQLAEDDKIRYKNEIKSWEDHMMEIGREDLIREQTLSARRKAATQTAAAKKGTKKPIVKKATAMGKSTTTRMTTKTVRTTKQR